MSAVLAGSELDTKCQIPTTSPALISGACRAGWFTTLTVWIRRCVKKFRVGSTLRFHHRLANDRFPRISPVAAHSGDRLLSEPTAGTQPCRREPLFMVESECDAGGFRSTLSVAAPFVWRCLTRLPVAPVSTPLSSNRTCRFAASGSRTRLHAFTHDGPRPSWVRRTSPKCP